MYSNKLWSKILFYCICPIFAYPVTYICTHQHRPGSIEFNTLSSIHGDGGGVAIVAVATCLKEVSLPHSFWSGHCLFLVIVSVCVWPAHSLSLCLSVAVFCLPVFRIGFSTGPFLRLWEGLMCMCICMCMYMYMYRYTHNVTVGNDVHHTTIISGTFLLSCVLMCSVFLHPFMIFLATSLLLKTLQDFTTKPQKGLFCALWDMLGHMVSHC